VVLKFSLLLFAFGKYYIDDAHNIHYVNVYQRMDCGLFSLSHPRSLSVSPLFLSIVWYIMDVWTTAEMEIMRSTLVALILARLPTYLQHTASVTLHLVPDHQQIFSACQVGGGRMIARLSCGSSKIMLEVTEDRFDMRMSG